MLLPGPEYWKRQTLYPEVNGPQGKKTHDSLNQDFLHGLVEQQQHHTLLFAGVKHKAPSLLSSKINSFKVFQDF